MFRSRKLGQHVPIRNSPQLSVNIVDNINVSNRDRVNNVLYLKYMAKIVFSEVGPTVFIVELIFDQHVWRCSLDGNLFNAVKSI